ncbi:hypothetical protein COO60DRAFT_1557201 [Scenedesmus sp. NREL 46B-D3]|nr:hypothetical protein COO60DRAFT_1568414 [Scenedesmus sp. NREL 46B-D3]KAF6251787.1 hypothetical protein COO60DRAFT_1557201 [Scenedesmus sp. NREL 46B-D3]
MAARAVLWLWVALFVGAGVHCCQYLLYLHLYGIIIVIYSIYPELWVLFLVSLGFELINHMADHPLSMETFFDYLNGHSIFRIV